MVYRPTMIYDMRYRKKPVAIEAVKWNGDKVLEVTDLVREALEDNTLFRMGCDVIVDTFEGKMKASPGDYIIKGVQGELYPCKPDIFEKIYDKI